MAGAPAVGLLLLCVGGRGSTTAHGGQASSYTRCQVVPLLLALLLSSCVFA